MDFLDPAKKRANAIKLYIGYVLMAIIIGVGTLILLYIAYGYGVNKEGEIIQNGLVFVDSKPDDAAIFLNGQQRKERTNSRIFVPSGDYTLEIKKDGFRSWKRDFSLEGGSVERFAYPFLFPEKLITKDVRQYNSPPGLVTESPDRHWILLQQVGTNGAFDLVDINDLKVPAKTVTIPPEMLSSGANQSLQLVEWSTDNRHVLLKHNFENNSEFIIFDIEAVASSTNINKLLNISPSRVTLRDKKPDQLYLYSDATKRLDSADVKTKKISLLLESVLAFQSHGSDMLLYASTEGVTPGKVAVRILQDGKKFNLRELTANDTYLLDVARFNDTWYMAAGAKSEGRVFVYRDPFAFLKKSQMPLPIVMLKIDQPTFLSFSNNARFIAVQGGQNFAVYDAEKDRQHRYSLADSIDNGGKAIWMDGHRLMVNHDRKVLVFDYDGINQQLLNPILPGAQPLFDRDYNNLFTVAPSSQDAAKTALTQTDLRVPPAKQN